MLSLILLRGQLILLVMRPQSRNSESGSDAASVFR